MESLGALLIIVGIIAALFYFLPWYIALMIAAGWFMLDSGNNR